MKEEDIRKRDVFNRYIELARADAKTIFSDKSQFERIDCPACQGNAVSPAFEKDGFQYMECGRCDTLFVSPRPSYDQLMTFYEDSPSTRYWVREFFMPVAEVRREMIFRPRAEFIAKTLPQLNAGYVGDIGAGFGIFLEELKTLWPDATLHAIEPSIDMAKICEEKGLAVRRQMLEDLDPDVRVYDLLTSFELFEHLHHPGAFLANINRMLAPGGYLFLTTLNGLGFDIQILWERSKSVSPPHHLNFFNPWSLETLLNSCGFEVLDISTPGELDWDIIEGGYSQEQIDPGRFWKTVSKHASADQKATLQDWIKSSRLSSHMRVLARKG